MQIIYHGLVANAITPSFRYASPLTLVSATSTELVFANPLSDARFSFSGENLVYDQAGGLHAGSIQAVRQYSPDGKLTVEMLGLSWTLGQTVAAIEEIGSSGSREKLDALLSQDQITIYNRATSLQPDTVTYDFSGIDANMGFIGGQHDEVIHAGAGDLLVYASEGRDTIYGGSGLLTLHVPSEHYNLFQDRSQIEFVFPGSGGSVLESPYGFVTRSIDYSSGAGGKHLIKTLLHLEVDSPAGKITTGTGWEGGVGQQILSNFQNVLREGGLTIQHRDAASVPIRIALQEGEHLKIEGTYGTTSLTLEGSGSLHLDFGVNSSMYYESGVYVDFATGQMGKSSHYQLHDTSSILLEIGGSKTADGFVGTARDDIFNPRFGNDTIDGGAGIDTVQYLNDTHTDFSLYTSHIDLSRGTAELYNATAKLRYVQKLTNIEAVVGTVSNDTIIGDNKANRLVGNDGNDLIRGNPEVASGSPETASFLYRIYVAALGRVPDLVGYSGWLNRMTLGAANQDDVITLFSQSAEFTRDYAGMSHDDFVTNLYINVLNREPDAAGLRTWIAKMEAGLSKAAMLKNFVNSPEFIQRTNEASAEFAWRHDGSNIVDDIYRLYRATLDRDPDLAGYRDWIGLLQKGMSFEQAAKIFIGSKEFEQTYGALSDEDFVDLLYANVLGRNPDTAGRQVWLDRLSEGTLRENIVLGFSQSPEFSQATAEDLRDWMLQSAGGDTLQGGAGDDQLWGSEFSDVFVYNAAEKGADQLYRFETWDKLSFEGFDFETIADVRENLSQTEEGVVFDHDGVIFTLVDVELASLRDDNFLI